MGSIERVHAASAGHYRLHGPLTCMLNALTWMTPGAQSTGQVSAKSVIPVSVAMFGGHHA
ncbi:MAG: hypothetical protein OHK006_15570 [Thermodesulfovibrionales bacterium]